MAFIGACPTIAGAQTTEILFPSAETLLLGQVGGGSIADLTVKDGVEERICKFLVPSQSSPIVRVNWSFTTTKPNPNAIDFTVWAKRPAGAYQIQLLLRNNATGAYDIVLPKTPLTPAVMDYKGSATQTPFSQYVDGNNVIKGRVEAFAILQATAYPCIYFDMATMSVTG